MLVYLTAESLAKLKGGQTLLSLPSLVAHHWSGNPTAPDQCPTIQVTEFTRLMPRLGAAKGAGCRASAGGW